MHDTANQTLAPRRNPHLQNLKEAWAYADSILVGQPAPFSILAADGTLLIAKGGIVSNERIRNRLLCAGCVESELSGHPTAPGSQEGEQPKLHTSAQQAEAPTEPPLKAWQCKASSIASETHVAVRMGRNQGGETFLCHIEGANDIQGMMVSIPKTAQGALLEVKENETWIFRTLYLTAAVKFCGTIRKVQLAPTPIMYITPSNVEMREVRSSPRIAVNISTVVGTVPLRPAIISDLSVGGICIATERGHGELKVGAKLPVKFSLEQLGSVYQLCAQATIMTVRTDQPELHIAGARLKLQTEIERLVVHAFVQESLAQNLGVLWRLLFSAR